MSGVLELNGLQPVLATLGILENLLSELAEPTKEVLEMLKEKMQDYPPEPAGSTYNRTETLKNSWEETLILAGDTLGKLEAVGVRYGPFVQDSEMQAWMHRGRWQTNRSVAADNESQVIAIYETYLKERINRP